MLKKLNQKTVSCGNTHPVKGLQFGEGNFLRALADWMIDVLSEKINFNGAIQIVQPIRNRIRPDKKYQVWLNQ